MVLVLCPLASTVSVEARDKWLALLKDVAEVTIASEPDCIAYCWLRQSDDKIGTNPGENYLRGLEIYANEDALAITHRSSESYKSMRTTIAREKLLTNYPELTFRVPTGVGFLSKSSSTDLVGFETFVVISEYKTKGGRETDTLLQNLATVAQLLKNKPEVMSYWVLKFQDAKIDADVLVFERYASRGAYEVVFSSVGYREPEFDIESAQVKKTTWIGADVGFVRNIHI